MTEEKLIGLHGEVYEYLPGNKAERHFTNLVEMYYNDIVVENNFKGVERWMIGANYSAIVRRGAVSPQHFKMFLECFEFFENRGIKKQEGKQ